MFKKVAICFLILFSSFTLGGCGNKQMPTSSKTPTVFPTAEPTKAPEVAVKRLPFVSITPSADNHWLTLEIRNFPQGTQSLEYELIYLAEVEEAKVERGISTIGTPVDLTGQNSFTKKLLLGSASCTTGTCKYKYDEGVKEGTFSLVINGSFGKEKYQSSFRIQNGSEGKTGLTTNDQIFSFVSPSLVSNSSYLTVSSGGLPLLLPQGVEAQTLSYGIFSLSKTSKGEVTFKTNLSEVDIYGFDGKTWKKLPTNVENGIAKATSSGESVFVLAKTF